MTWLVAHIWNCSNICLICTLLLKPYRKFVFWKRENRFFDCFSSNHSHICSFLQTTQDINFLNSFSLVTVCNFFFFNLNGVFLLTAHTSSGKKTMYNFQTCRMYRSQIIEVWMVKLSAAGKHWLHLRLHKSCNWTCVAFTFFRFFFFPLLRCEMWMVCFCWSWYECKASFLDLYLNKYLYLHYFT